MPNHPNILQLTTHDTGRHFGCYGHPTLHTPNIDALSADGVRFGNYFAAVPICCASRATMLTSLYPQSHGLLDLCFAPFDWRLRQPERHLSHILRTAGYRKLLFGMQHEAADTADLALEAMTQPVIPCAQLAEALTGYLKSEAAGQQPFYIQVGFLETHTAWDFGGAQPDDSLGVEVPPYLVDNAGARTAMAQFQGALRQVDGAVGTILRALRESGLEDNTIIVFTTDHGIELPRAKWHVYDPGIAIGLVMRYPPAGWIGGRVCDQLLSNVDYLPTLLELAGLEVPGYCEGYSFAGALENLAPLREAVYAMYLKDQTRCVRTARYKWIRHFDAASDYARVPLAIEDVMMHRGIPLCELYDLAADPNEFDNLFGRAEYAGIQAELDRMLWRWLESVDEPLLHGPVRTPSYESASRDYARWQGQSETNRE
ncbi:MAG: sulfatase family protein [Anaerolineae bacterium]